MTLDATDPALVALGKAIRDIRTAAGLTQDDVADKIGCARSSVANIEAGRQDTTVTRLVAIADVLGVSPAYLLPGGEDSVRRVSSLLAEIACLRSAVSCARAALDNAQPGTEWREAAAKIRGDRHA
jgi:transcriptional regulator with XRE-family HTH domain